MIRGLYSYFRASDDIVDTYATLSVRVENRFDEVPVVTVFENASIHEELLPGTVITVFNVTDSDIDDELEYSLQGIYCTVLFS